jgi:hypothetical protein
MNLTRIRPSTDPHRRLAIACLAIAAFLALLLVPAPNSASADVGIAHVSRHAGQPGEEVTVTVGCACFPPCKGPKGHRHPEGFKQGPCTLGSKARQPASFGVSLLPHAQASAQADCPHRPCPSLPQDPHARPYTFLGLALPPAGGNNPETGSVPHYDLTFTIPALRSGTYSYVIWCTACVRGHRGPLIANPTDSSRQLVVRPPGDSARGSLSEFLSMLPWRW